MVNIVLHAIFLQPFEYQGVYIRRSEMPLSNQGHMTSCAKIVIEIPKTYIYVTPLSCFIDCCFWPSENTCKVRQGFLTAQYFTCLSRTSIFITSMLKTVYRMISPDMFSKKGVLLQICFIFLKEYPYRSVISVELNSHFRMDVLL